MIIGNYTADDSVGEAAPSPISPEPWCLKDTIRGGRVVDGGDACHVSAGDSPAGVGVGSIELSRDEADTVDMLRSSLGGESSRDDAARSTPRARASFLAARHRVFSSGPVFFVSERVSSRKLTASGGVLQSAPDSSGKIAFKRSRSRVSRW